jgi:hypothetical protein
MLFQHRPSIHCLASSTTLLRINTITFHFNLLRKLQMPQVSKTSPNQNKFDRQLQKGSKGYVE